MFFFIKEFCGSEKKELVEKLEEILDDVAKSGQYMYVLPFAFFIWPKGLSPNLVSNINPVQPNVAYLYPLKTSENL